MKKRKSAGQFKPVPGSDPDDYDLVPMWQAGILTWLLALVAAGVLTIFAPFAAAIGVPILVIGVVAFSVKRVWRPRRV